MTPTKPWIMDLEGACERSGDLHSVSDVYDGYLQSLPRHTDRISEMLTAATACDPLMNQGVKAKIKWIKEEVRNFFSRNPDNAVEVERLRKLIKEIGGTCE